MRTRRSPTPSLSLAALLAALLLPSTGLAGFAPDESLLDAFRGKDVADTFARVATGVRYEPYRGVLRGALGCAASAAGNDLDQALLLAAVLRRDGYRVRLVEGTLGEENLRVLLRGLYPPRIVEGRPDGFDPSSDPVLRAAASRHVWVEIDQGKSWLPLDPSYPRAKVGEAYAVAERRYEEPDASAYHLMRLTFHETTGEGSRILAEVEGTAAELALRPIALTSTAVPLRKTGAAKPAGADVKRLWGSAFGGPPKKKEDAPPEELKVLGTLVLRELTVDGSPREAGDTVVVDGDSSTTLRREWLEVAVQATGEEPRTVTRELFSSDAGQELLPLRQQVLTVLPGPVTRSWLRSRQARGRAMLPLEEWKKEASTLAKSEKQSDGETVRERVTATASAAGHLMALAHASEADGLASRAALGTNAVLVHDRPRVLIATFAGDSSEPDTMSLEATLDLRLDSVRAFAFPGASPGLARTALRGRGLIAASIEGSVLHAATGQRRVVTAMTLMDAALRAGAETLVVSTDDRSGLGKIAGLPGWTRRRVDATLREGRQVIIPSKTVELDGQPRIGWLEVDPKTGETVGVLDRGEHGAMAEYTVKVEKIGLNPWMGYAIGMLVGAQAAVGLICVKMLEYGEMTAQAIKEIEDALKAILCSSCPGAELKQSVSISASDCAKLELAVGVGAKLDFCGKFADGFKCTSGAILSSLKGEPVGYIGLTESTELTIGCLKAERKQEKKWGVF